MNDIHVNALAIARRLPTKEWLAPRVDPVTGGWLYVRRDRLVAIIVSAGESAEAMLGESSDHSLWLHASIARRDRMPDYDDLVLLHHAAFGDAWAYQCFAPPAAHINIHPRALHLWGRVDGEPAMPNFGALGTI